MKEDQQIVADWRRIIVDDHKSWVVFKNGTCVVVMQPDDDLAEQAVSILKQWGPVHAGSASGDFKVNHLTEYPGWVVMCHHPEILTYISLDEVILPQTPDMIIGLLGRSMRHADAESLEILHIEDRRGR